MLYFQRFDTDGGRPDPWFVSQVICETHLPLILSLLGAICEVPGEHGLSTCARAQRVPTFIKTLLTSKLRMYFSEK